MANLDDDLLDLAGGDSGDEGSDNQSRHRSETPQPVKKDTKKPPVKKHKRRDSRHASEDEEGEA